jgi:transcription antitermination factor NusG
MVGSQRDRIPSESVSPCHLKGTEYAWTHVRGRPHEPGISTRGRAVGSCAHPFQVRETGGGVLCAREIAHFLPLIKRRNVGNREIRYFDVPLFPGYVFLDTSAMEPRDLFRSRKVAQVLEAEDQDTLRRELSDLYRALAVDDRLCEARWGEVGRPVRVVRGRFRDLTGEVVRVEGGARLLIRVSFIARAAYLQIDESLVEPQ